MNLFGRISFLGILAVCGCGSSNDVATGAAGAAGAAANVAGSSGNPMAGGAASGGSATGTSGATQSGGANNGSGGLTGGVAGSSAENDGGPVGGGSDAGSGCSADQPCLGGVCVGTTCGGTWTCESASVACTRDLAPYCGCDGQEFLDSSSCPTRPFAHFGGCASEDASCNQAQVACDSLPPSCDEMTVPSVVGGCYGPCVPIDSCVCQQAEDCPSPNSYTCHLSAGHCGPYVN